MMLEEVTYDVLQDRDVVLGEGNHEHLAEMFEYHLPELTCKLGAADDEVRQRLRELVGIRVP